MLSEFIPSMFSRHPGETIATQLCIVTKLLCSGGEVYERAFSTSDGFVVREASVLHCAKADTQCQGARDCILWGPAWELRALIKSSLSQRYVRVNRYGTKPC